uniref:lymphoid enhancer-binding factor 1-like n=1 Tax=Doryrhamphus excisus TaxID=161450 RepID=UPI0025AEA1E8|nr:lymphoid enhancer-binding factor 1-like [Doryrhamphus excisus]
MKPMKEAAGEEFKWSELLMPLLEPIEGIYGDLDYHQCHSQPPPSIDPDDLPLFTSLTENDIGYLGNHITYSPPSTSIDLDDLPLANVSSGSQDSDWSDCSNQADTVLSRCPQQRLVEQPDDTMLTHQEQPKILPDWTTLTHTEIPGFTNVSTSNRKRKRDVQENGDKAYIKKPPNAFMLFRKEQRLKVMAQFNISGCAEANKVLGHMWRSLSEQEQEKYYRLADAEKVIHSQLYPNWSCTENYGRKRKQRAGLNKENTPIHNFFPMNRYNDIPSCDLYRMLYGREHLAVSSKIVTVYFLKSSLGSSAL